MPAKRTGPRNIPARPVRGGRRPSPRSSGNSPGTGALLFVLGAATAAGAGYLYLHSTPQPHPTTQPQQVLPRTTERREALPPRPAAVASPPFGTSEDAFEAGARSYASRCATCHGSPRRDGHSLPPAPQLWRAARHSIAMESPGQIYARITVGPPHKGLGTLTDTQLWQLALLLKNADGDLPDPVIGLLNQSAHPPTSASK